MSVPDSCLFDNTQGYPTSASTLGGQIQLLGNDVSFSNNGDNRVLLGFSCNSLTNIVEFSILNNGSPFYSLDMSGVVDGDGVYTGFNMYYYPFPSAVILNGTHDLYTFRLHYGPGTLTRYWMGTTVTSSYPGVTPTTTRFYNSIAGGNYANASGYWFVNIYISTGVNISALVSGSIPVSLSIFRKGHSASLISNISSTWFSATGGAGSTVVSTSDSDLTVDSDTLMIDAVPGASTTLSSRSFNAAYSGNNQPLSIDLDITVLDSFGTATADVTPVDDVTAEFDTLETSGASQIVMSASTLTARSSTTTMSLGTNLAFTQGTSVSSSDKPMALSGTVSLQGTSSLSAGTKKSVTMAPQTTLELENRSSCTARAIEAAGTSVIRSATTGKMQTVDIKGCTIRLQGCRQAFLG